ncbi:hypothetical protein HpBT166_02180 [Helicobacter pylori]
MSGNLKGLRECHVKPNLLLIYEIKKQENELVLLRLDTHSELFKKWSNTKKIYLQQQSVPIFNLSCANFKIEHANF